MSAGFLTRTLAVLLKEFVQLRRDRLTFAMMIGVPTMQLLLFGYAINLDPKGLPTLALAGGDGPFTRAVTQALENSGYFRIVGHAASPSAVDRALITGEVQFAVRVPADFERKLMRGERPAVLVEADATDPAATGNALAALARLNETALRHDLTGPLAPLASNPEPAFEFRIHRRYNPEGITQYNIVPGLLGVVLTMTMVMMTAMALTRERERGTIENLLAMPVSPLEVMIGKIVPYIAIGYIQAALILLAARGLFGVPAEGSLVLLMSALALFMLANLAVGFTFSVLARSQMQAMQMTFFFFLPSILLSGFMFPFRGMPDWAQAVGEVLPLTHFLRIVRGILLKGAGPGDIAGELVPLALFLLGAGLIAVLRYRRTLD